MEASVADESTELSRQVPVQPGQTLNVPVSAPIAPRPRELKVEDALLYLDQVKMEFHDKPHIYNEFLEIMKNFKAQSITTPGVIERVKNLFRGYNKLILGFNTFLPEGEGYKIELTPEEQEGPNLSRLGAARDMPTGLRLDQSLLDRPESAFYSGNYVSGQITGQGNVLVEPGGFVPTKPPQQMQQQHAITYVTTIRNRFANEPETYRAFLRILHTYQKEQKSIKDVLEQVSSLFADHPDLLMEFTYFLPDSVQEQAKERLQRAARESENRRHGRPGGLVPGVGGMGGPGMGGPGQVQAYPPGVAGSGQGPKRRRMGEGGRGQGGPGGEGGGRGRGAGGPAKKVNSGKRSASGMAIDTMAISGVQGQTDENTGGVSQSVIKQQQHQLHQQQQQQQHQQQSLSQQQNSQQHFFHDASRIENKLRSNAQSQSQALNKVPQVLTKPQYGHISGTAERYFFDQTKEVLSIVSRDTWHEFVKCLELFSSGALTKSDLLVLTKDLFSGASGMELFDEFKRLLSSRADFDARGGDMWYAVPFAEVDFSQCRKCTPSYRALPRDFPPLVCSERDISESAVLNDQWVSIPIGSEESYSFKHMRKNQFEEALFKCEDERFEIDMVIDSNMSTIRALEPLEQELAQLTALEEVQAPRIAGIGGSIGPLRVAPRFSLQLDKRGLSTIHLNAITRLYGEHGAEILDLLRKNPAGTIPVLVRRLKQKDAEWRRARAELNKQWKEVVVKNYEKSLDHRSFYFKQQDKRVVQQRCLVGEIKTAMEALAGLTDGSSSGVETGVTGSDDLKLHEVTRAVSPEFVPFLAGMTPHLVLKYNAQDYSIHRDIYCLMCLSVDHGSGSNTNHVEKERIPSLWRDLFRVLFSLPTDFLYGGNLKPNHNHSDAYLWPIGTRVVTMYGSGRVVGYRVHDKMYRVQLPFGLASLQGSTIIGAEELSISSLKIIGVTPNPAGGNDVVFDGEVCPSDGNLPKVSDPCRLLFGTQMTYIFLRLHHILYTRLQLARQLARVESQNSPFPHNFSHLDDGSDDEMVGMTGAETGRLSLLSECQNRYSVYLGQLYALITGTIDSTKYEDACRHLLGNRAFVLYTLDKVIVQATKCLQALASDDVITKLVGLFVYHRSFGAGHVDPDFYLGHVGAILSNTMEDVYRIQVLAPKDCTSPYVEIACQFIGSASGGASQASAEIQRAPQLVLEDDDEDEPTSTTVEVKTDLNVSAGGSGEGGRSYTAEGDERIRITGDGDGMDVDGDLADGVSEGDDHTDQSGLLTA